MIHPIADCEHPLLCLLGPGIVSQETINDFLEFDKNEATIYPNSWDTMKAFLRVKLIVLSGSKKKLERAHTSSLRTHLKALEQKEANSPRRSRQQEIINLRGEINQVETRRTIQRINQLRSWFFEKINKINKPLAKLTKRQRETTQISKKRSGKEDKIDTEEIRRIITSYF